MTEIALTFKFELLEDLHAGTGVGRLGIVDDTQSRDQRDNPVVLASTLRGLLREAGEDWLWARQRAGIDVCADRRRMQDLLGRTVESKKSDNSEEPSSPGRAVVSSLRLAEDQQPKFVIWSSTAREKHSRRPDDSTLRQVEYATAGLQFSGEIRVPSGDERDVALFKNLLSRVTALGSTRTRGWGEVQLLGDPEAEELKPEPSRTIHGSPLLRLVLRNLEPLNLATTAMAGNLIGCESYIPGTRLRAALLHWLSNRGHTGLADALAQSMTVSNAYFVPGDATEIKAATVAVVPLPLSVYAPKGGQNQPTGTHAPAPIAGLPWWAEDKNRGPGIAPPEERDMIAWPLPGRDKTDEHAVRYAAGADFKRIKTEDYAVLTAVGWQRVRPKMGVLLRNMVPTVSRDGLENGRAEARKDRAALFSEQVLWEDQCFIADLRFATPEDAVKWQEAANALIGGANSKKRSWLRIGRGGRPVVVEQCVAGKTISFPEQEKHLTLTLTSDLIARTPWLTFVTDLCVGDLARLIQEAGGDLVPTVGVTIDATFNETTEVYGFNAATGLPRAAALTIKRGSVFQLSGLHVRAWREALRKVNAFGERTADGFGRFVLDLPLHEKDYWESAKAGDAAEARKEKPDPAEEVLKKVNKLLGPDGWNLRTKTAKELRGKDWPSVTQWQWLRTQAQVATNLDDELAKLITQAGKLAGHRWGNRPKEIADKVKELADHKEKKQFLNYLAQAVVAHMRRQRRKMEDRS